MSLKFFYERWSSKILDECETQAMNWEEGSDSSNTETPMTSTQYKRTRIMIDLDPADRHSIQKWKM